MSRQWDVTRKCLDILRFFQRSRGGTEKKNHTAHEACRKYKIATARAELNLLKPQELAIERGRRCLREQSLYIHASVSHWSNKKNGEARFVSGIGE